MKTAYGVPLGPDERVVFVHVPPPISVGERILLTIVGIWMIPVFLTGILIIRYAFRKPDRAWFLTTHRAINVTRKGIVQVALEDVTGVFKYKNSSTMDLRDKKNQGPTLPLAGMAGGVHVQEIAANPKLAMNLPEVPAPA